MKVFLAKNIGFCPGVKRAIAMVEKTIEKEHGPIFMLGPLIHNKRVVADFIKQGVKIVSVWKKIPKGSSVIISAHGAGPKTIRRLLKRKVKIIDTTCCWVSHAQKLAERLSLDGYQIILVGDKNHRETKGIKEWTKIGRFKIVSNIAEARKFLKKKSRNQKITLFAQTTQSEDNFKKISELFKKIFPRIKILNTICPDNRERQKETKEMAKKTDMMLVIGSKDSANSKRLAKIAKNINKNAHFISGPESLEKSWFLPKIEQEENFPLLYFRFTRSKRKQASVSPSLPKIKKIGIISGASTPLKTVKEIEEQIIHISLS